MTTSTSSLTIETLTHPQGCRTYLLVDPASKHAMAVDVHLDFVDDVTRRVQAEGWTLRYVVDTHTHADHPSGSGAVADRLSSTRVAHELAQHAGVSHHPKDGEVLKLGDADVTVRHAPGHTPDHIVLLTDGTVLAGDTVLIGGVARTDFLGGDAGQLFDSIHGIFDELPDETVILPGHDYQGRERTTLGDEREGNAWLRMTDRDDFVRQLSANPPPRPANMDDLLRLNREGVDIPASISAGEAAQRVAAGGAGSIIDVRTGLEYQGEHIAGSQLIPLDQIAQRADDVRRTPAPRMILCRTGPRAERARQALAELHVAGLTVVEGGIEAFAKAGGATEVGKAAMSLERQVRIAAGAIVLIGVTLGFLVHPGLFFLAGFVGAGLVFAGITDWCGMGLLLAKAPWNRSSAGGASAAPPACSAAPPACSAAPPACSAGAPSACAAPAPKPE